MTATCAVAGCRSPRARKAPVCRAHWQVLSDGARRAWEARRRDEPWRPILARLLAEAERLLPPGRLSA